MMSVHAPADLDRRLAFSPTLYSLHMVITSIEYYTFFSSLVTSTKFQGDSIIWTSCSKVLFSWQVSIHSIQTLYDYCIVWTSSATQCFKYNFNMYLMRITDHFPSCCGKQSKKYAFCQMLFRWGLWNCNDKCVCTGFIDLDPFWKLTGDLNIKTKNKSLILPFWMWVGWVCPSCFMCGMCVYVWQSKNSTQASSGSQFQVKMQSTDTAAPAAWSTGFAQLQESRCCCWRLVPCFLTAKCMFTRTCWWRSS